MARWKAAGAGARARSTTPCGPSSAALQDQFFNARQAALSEQDAEFTGQPGRQGGPAREGGGRPSFRSTDLATARAAFRSFLEQYNALGKVPREAIRGLDNRVQALESAVRRPRTTSGGAPIPRPAPAPRRPSRC